jgi:hypothetical protein
MNSARARREDAGESERVTVPVLHVGERRSNLLDLDELELRAVHEAVSDLLADLYDANPRGLLSSSGLSAAMWKMWSLRVSSAWIRERCRELGAPTLSGSYAIDRDTCSKILDRLVVIDEVAP